MFCVPWFANPAVACLWFGLGFVGADGSGCTGLAGPPVSLMHAPLFAPRPFPSAFWVAVGLVG